MNNYEVLEVCLQELENGADLELLLKRYPEQADELQVFFSDSFDHKQEYEVRNGANHDIDWQRHIRFQENNQRSHTGDINVIKCSITRMVATIKIGTDGG